MESTFFLFMDPNQVIIPTHAQELPRLIQSQLPPSSEAKAPAIETVAETDNNDSRACQKCGKLCKGPRGYRLHYTKAHLKKKRHVRCQLCGREFAHKYGMRFHLKQVHSQVLRVPCQVCGMVLYNKYMLPKHMQKFHPTEALEECSD